MTVENKQKNLATYATYIARGNRRKYLKLLVPGERFELPTNGLQNRCSTTELTRHSEGIQLLSHFDLVEKVRIGADLVRQFPGEAIHLLPFAASACSVGMKAA